jgi:chromosome segregation ATPase
VRQIEYKTITDNMNQIERELRVLARYDEELRTGRAEDQRLSEALQRLEVAVADLSTRSDERVKAVTYLEEQRRADNRRITDLERDTTELHKRIETIATKLPLLEETLQKQRSRIEEAIQETKKYEKPIEELRISDFQREQKMKQYLNQAEQVAEEMERIRTQTQGFLEHQQMVKRALKKLEGFQARLEKRQNEVAEMQRVASDRIKRQWEEWEEEQARQKKKQDVVTEERWRQQAQTNDTHMKHLKALQSTTGLHHNQLDTLWETRRADATDVLKAVQDLYENLMAPIDEQLAILRGEQQE